MKNLLLLLILLTIGCAKNDSEIDKYWLAKNIDFSSIQNVTNYYNMFDSTGSKIGSMVLTTFFQDGFLVAQDTSQFDDGSIFETAEFLIDTSNFTLMKVKMNIEVPSATAELNISKVDDGLIGDFKVVQDTSKMIVSIDSIYDYSIVREELYFLLQTLPFQKGDTINFDAFVTVNRVVSKAQLIFKGTDQLTTTLGSFDCDLLALKTDGNMPENEIWISKTSPRRLVKIYVPASGLNIDLVDIKPL